MMPLRLSSPCPCTVWSLSHQMSFLFPIRFKEHLLGICCVLSSGHMLKTQTRSLVDSVVAALAHGSVTWGTSTAWEP